MECENGLHLSCTFLLFMNLVSIHIACSSFCECVFHPFSVSDGLWKEIPSACGWNPKWQKKLWTWLQQTALIWHWSYLKCYLKKFHSNSIQMTYCKLPPFSFSIAQVGRVHVRWRNLPFICIPHCFWSINCFISIYRRRRWPTSSPPTRWWTSCARPPGRRGRGIYCWRHDFSFENNCAFLRNDYFTGSSVPVYNLSSGGVNPITWGEVRESRK